MNLKDKLRYFLELVEKVNTSFFLSVCKTIAKLDIIIYLNTNYF